MCQIGPFTGFDNNQRLMKTYMIKYQGKMVVSVVTAMIAFDFGAINQHQFHADIPTALMPTSANRDVLLDRC